MARLRPTNVPFSHVRQSNKQAFTTESLSATKNRGAGQIHGRFAPEFVDRREERRTFFSVRLSDP
jgi:hypothetical protein